VFLYVKVPSPPYKRGREGTCKRIQTFWNLCNQRRELQSLCALTLCLNVLRTLSRVRGIIRIFQVTPQQAAASMSTFCAELIDRALHGVLFFRLRIRNPASISTSGYILPKGTPERSGSKPRTEAKKKNHTNEDYASNKFSTQATNNPCLTS
jgi:hypothetical protein